MGNVVPRLELYWLFVPSELSSLSSHFFSFLSFILGYRRNFTGMLDKGMKFLRRGEEAKVGHHLKKKVQVINRLTPHRVRWPER